MSDLSSLKETLIMFAASLNTLAADLMETDTKLTSAVGEIENLIGGSGAKTDLKVNTDLDNAGTKVKDAADSCAAASKTLNDFALSL